MNVKGNTLCPLFPPPIPTSTFEHATQSNPPGINKNIIYNIYMYNLYYIYIYIQSPKTKLSPLPISAQTLESSLAVLFL